MREPLLALNERITRRLSEGGFPDVRPAHGSVFQFIDDTGSRVSALAERAQMTKQSMGELIAHLERHGYVERVPDPSDGRAKLVRPTARGMELTEYARAVLAETVQEWTRHLGAKRMRELVALLEDLNEALR